MLEKINMGFGVSVHSLPDEPDKAALEVIDRYFTSLKHPKRDQGTPVESYRIIDLDASNSNFIRIGAAVVFKGLSEEMPVTNFYVVKEDDYYRVESEKVIYDMAPSSPSYGEIISGARINEIK